MNRPRLCTLLLVAILQACCAGAWRPMSAQQLDAGPWGQCGGSDHCPSETSCGDRPWDGVTTCPTGTTCVRLDPFYWQCQPNPTSASSTSYSTEGTVGPYAQCGGTNGPCPAPPCKDAQWAKCRLGFDCDRYSEYFWSCKPSFATHSDKNAPNTTTMSSSPAPTKHNKPVATSAPGVSPNPTLVVPGGQIPPPYLKNSTITPPGPDTPPATVHTSDTTTPCLRKGDADILGLGVRIGMYLSTFGLLGTCCKNKCLKDIKDTLISTLPLAVSLMAVFTEQAVARTVSDFGLLAGFYVLGVYWLAMGVPLSWYVMEAHDNDDVVPGLTAFIACALNLWVQILQLWFWASGYKRLQSTACGTTYAFALVRVEAYGPFRIFVLVVSGMALLVASLNIVPFMWYAVTGMVQHIMVWSLFLLASDDEAEAKIRALSLAEAQRRNRTIVWCALPSVVINMAINIVGAELTILWNQMDEVKTLNGTGQVLALVSGVVTVFLMFRAVVDDMFDNAVAAAPEARARRAELFRGAAARARRLEVAAAAAGATPAALAALGDNFITNVAAAVERVPGRMWRGSQAGNPLNPLRSMSSPPAFGADAEHDAFVSLRTRHDDSKVLPVTCPVGHPIVKD